MRLTLQGENVIGAVGLIDLYGSGIPYPEGTTRQRYAWAKRELESHVDDPRFRQHFAVHETEAWLLSDPGIFNNEISAHLPKKGNPETVNGQNPPSHRLKALYRQKLGKTYNKPLEGTTLFRKLDPKQAYDCCPHLKLLLDDMLDIAEAAPR